MALQGSGNAALLVLILLCVLAGSAVATSYTVGDSSGWTQGVDYNAWAAGKTFQKGDTLVFNFSPMHSVLQVYESSYNSCTTSNHLREFRSGSTVTLQDDSYYFICGTPGHCIPNGGAGGENLAVKVSASSPGGGTGTTPNPPQSSAASGLQGATTLAVASMAFIPLLL